MELCAICNRPLTGDFIQEHHLTPKTFKGKETVRLHKACHQKLHATISEREMQHYYHTIERLLEHEEIQKFIKWIQKKPVDYYDKSNDTIVRYSKR